MTNINRRILNRNMDDFDTKYYSVKTKKFYDTPEALRKDVELALNAEKKDADKKAKRAEDAKHLDELRLKAEKSLKAYSEDYKVYEEALKKFVREYGSYHTTYKLSGDDEDLLFPEFASMLFTF